MFINFFVFSCNEETKNNKINRIEISTSGCHKRCPVLDVKLMNRKIYFHFFNTEKKGYYKYVLTTNDFMELNRLFNKVRFDSLKNEYSSQKPDVQKYNTLIEYDEKKQLTFFFRNESTEEYQNLIEYLISFSEKELKKIDTTFETKTRKRIPYLKIDIPRPPSNIEDF